MVSPTRLVLLGVFGAAQGVRGEVRVKSFTAEPKAIGGYGVLTDASGARAFRFESARPLRDDMLVVRLAGVTTRDAAATLTGVEIFARRDQLPPPAADEFYYDDLIGLTAVTTDGAPLGRVVALSNFGAGDILEIDPGRGPTWYLPFTRECVPEVDLAGGRIVAVRPAETSEREP